MDMERNWFEKNGCRFRFHLNEDGESVTIDEVWNFSKNPTLSIPGSIPAGKEGKLLLATKIGRDAFKAREQIDKFGIEHLHYYVGDANILEFGEGIKEIAAMPYWDENPYEDLEMISLPSSLEKIGIEGLNPFSGTLSLKEIRVNPENPYFYAEEGVLYQKKDGKCSLLCYPLGKKNREFKVPEGVTDINFDAFKGSENLTKVSLPSTLKAIYSQAFKDCISLKEVDFNSSVSHFGYEVFSNCPSLKEVKLYSDDPSELDLDIAFDSTTSIEILKNSQI